MLSHPDKSQSDIAIFLKQLLRDPRHVGAVLPSSSALSRTMTRDLNADTGHVVELGGGTGRISRAILAAGVRPTDLTILEMNPIFCEALRDKLPGVQVVNRMAQDLPELGLKSVTSIVSGLPLLNMSRNIQHAIVSAAFQTLVPGGSLVQFTYGLRPPLADEVIQVHDLVWQKREKVWANVPPADVYVFRKKPHA